MAAKRARASAEGSRAAVTPSSSEHDTSTIASASSSVSPLQRERECPQLSAGPSEGMSIVEGPNVSSDEYEREDDIFDDECAQDAFDEFILSLPLDHRHMLAVILAESFRKTQGIGVVNVAREEGSIVRYGDKIVCKLRRVL